MREAKLIEAGPKFDPEWGGGRGRSAAAYGNASDPNHQIEYRAGQFDAWEAQQKRVPKEKASAV